MEYINKNFTRSFSLDQLASACNTSASRLSHVFKAHTRTSPVEYRKHLRLSSAAERIKSTPDKLFAIAKSSGFNSLAQFYKMFKKEFGRSPTALRNHTR
jgi:transcriptional regulator GlxA family with amidase domain